MTGYLQCRLDDSTGKLFGFDVASRAELPLPYVRQTTISILGAR